MNQNRNKSIIPTIDSFMRNVTKACRDKFAHAHAKELVPIAELVQSNLEILENGDYRDNLLPLVVDWFSNNFFSWFDTPECDKCEANLELHQVSNNTEGKSVENYKCSGDGCNYTYDFIRHNEPAILLATRKGRCGEWAMCFLVILRALDYDARIVYDSTDHLWNEVWSETKGRWVHVDPCEGVIDSPLLYEVGWRKKLEYCIAFQQYSVLDVTRRYSIDFNETKKRRSCDENWLDSHIHEINERLINNVPTEDLRKQIKDRIDQDLKFLGELTSQPRIIPDKSQLQGRKTGSLSWRIQRGEYSPIVKKLAILELKDDHMRDSKPRYSLKYNSLDDTYNCSSGLYCSKKWSSIIYESENIDYKYEKDWRCSYLARYEGCPYDQIGKITWRFDLSHLTTWSRLEVQLRGKVYPKTTIELCLKMIGDEHCLETIHLDLDKVNLITNGRLRAETKFLDLVAILSGGDSSDEVCWQKPQLFRQTRGQNSAEWPFILEIF